MTIRFLCLAASAAAMAACSPAKPEPETTTPPVMAEAEMPAPAPAAVEADATVMEFDAASLDTILAAQDDSAKARYEYRNPKETLEFFGIAPGMAVGEALPGGGWYSKILLPYLGD